MVNINSDLISNENLEPVYVARQPVFDTDMEIWGYELLFRSGTESNLASFEDGDMATSRVVVDGFSMAVDMLTPGQKVLINYPSSMLLKKVPWALPSETAVVEILETVEPDQDILKICKQLKSDGYVLALDDFVGSPGYEPFLEIADIVKVDVLDLGPQKLVDVAKNLQNYPCIMLAEKVEFLETFDFCRKIGFKLFQGYFFSKPQIVSGKKLAANQLSKLDIMRELGAADIDMKKISHIIQADVSLSYRLLRYINSAGMGLTHKIKSISQAVNMLGQRKISTWLQVIVMAEMNSTARAGELLQLSLQRARFLEIICKHTRTTPLPPDSMFILGLFSYLDALLSQPMEEIIEKISLEPRMSEALLGHDKELGVWLSLVKACERGDWESAAAALKLTGLNSSVAAISMNAAGIWARKFLDMA